MIAFIPARGGSKSVKKKNIKELGGKPLIAWTIEQALATTDRVIVNTDDDEIAKVAKKYGAEVQKRPSKLGKDDTSMFEVLESEIPKIEPIPEFVLLLQPTTPFRNKMQIKMAVSYFANNLEEYDSLVGVERVPDKWHPSETIVKTPSGLRMANGAQISQRITRRQDYPEAYVPTGSIYVFKTSNLESGSFYGDKIMLMEIDGTVNINSEGDFKEAWKLLQK